MTAYAPAVVANTKMRAMNAARARRNAANGGAPRAPVRKRTMDAPLRTSNDAGPLAG
jgi:hypothetical protein